MGPLTLSQALEELASVWEEAGRSMLSDPGALGQLVARAESLLGRAHDGLRRPTASQAPPSHPLPETLARLSGVNATNARRLAALHQQRAMLVAALAAAGDAPYGPDGRRRRQAALQLLEGRLDP